MTCEKRAQKIHTNDVSLPDLGGSAPNLRGKFAQPIRSTTQIRIVTRYQYEISALDSQTSFRGVTTGGVAKCRLFS